MLGRMFDNHVNEITKDEDITRNDKANVGIVWKCH